MTQRTKGSGLFIDFGLPSYLGNQEFRNEVANLAQQIHFRSRWNVVVFIFHPCRVAGRNEMFQLFLKILWDGCDNNRNRSACFNMLLFALEKDARCFQEMKSLNRMGWKRQSNINIRPCIHL